MKHIPENERLSLAECRAILNKGKKKYSDEMVKKIRNWLYQYTEMSLGFIENQTPDELKQIVNTIGDEKIKGDNKD